MLTFYQYLQLRPHGDRLLISSASGWILSVRILIFAMASSEALAWAYLGFLFGTGPGRWVTALFAGTLMFVVVWIVDASMITLDRAWNDHAKSILRLQSGLKTKTFAKDFARFGLRIGLLVASLTVTSPYLTQMVFYRDIEERLNVDAVNQIAGARQHVNQSYSAEIQELKTQSERKLARFEEEMAGKGKSGVYGEGPVAHAMKLDLQTVEGQIRDQEHRRDEALTKFDNLAANWRSNRDTLSALYGLSLPQPSIVRNRETLETLRQRPENRATELAVKVFLAIIFSGLLLLKLFEPSSVRLYLSEVLQQEYDRYRAGTFDSMLPVAERSTTEHSSMTPQHFYEFLVRTWVPANARPETIAANQSLTLLLKIRDDINSEVAQATAEVERVCLAADDSHRSITELRSAISSVSADLADFRDKLANKETYPRTLDEQGRVEYQSFLRSKIGKAHLTLNGMEEALPAELEKKQRLNGVLAEVRQRLADKISELTHTQGQIREVRALLSTAVGSAASAVLGANG